MIRALGMMFAANFDGERVVVRFCLRGLRAPDPTARRLAGRYVIVFHLIAGLFVFLRLPIRCHVVQRDVVVVTILSAEIQQRGGVRHTG